MGKLNEKAFAVIGEAATDLSDGHSVMILTGSAAVADEVFAQLETWAAGIATYKREERVVTSIGGGWLQVVPIRNERDLERLRGRQTQVFVLIDVHRSVLDRLSPWLSRPGVTTRLAA